MIRNPASPTLGGCQVTTSEKETRGLTALEAFAAGIPVIAPNSGGIVENIHHGSNGLLYTPGDRHDFIDKLQTLIEHESLRQEMGDRAHNSVRAYSWEQAVENLVDLWEEEIQKRHKSITSKILDSLSIATQ